MTAIFVLSLIIIGLTWITNVVCTIIKITDAYGTETGIYLIAIIIHTIKNALLIIFISILYANIS